MINKKPSPDQFDINDYVDRLRRMHRNDLENIPTFLVAGLLFVTINSSQMMAQIPMYGFVPAFQETCRREFRGFPPRIIGKNQPD